MQRQQSKGLCLIAVILLVVLGTLGMGAYFLSGVSHMISDQVKFLVGAAVFMGILVLAWKMHKDDASKGDELEVGE